MFAHYVQQELLLGQCLTCCWGEACTNSELLVQKQQLLLRGDADTYQDCFCAASAARCSFALPAFCVRQKKLTAASSSC